MRRACALLAATLAAFASCAGATSPASGAVSLDYCADQYLIALAERDEIIAVSPGADEEYARFRNEAAGLAQARPTAEEIAPLAPAVVIRSWGGDARLMRLLERRGSRIVTLGYADDFDGVADNIRLVAGALGAEKKGDALIADMKARLAALDEKPLGVAALYVTPGGVTAGEGTMIDAILKAAGAANAAAESGLSGWAALPAETLFFDPPQALVTGFFAGANERTNHWSAARHPAFARLFGETPTVHLSADVLSCAGWFAVEAAEAINAGLTKTEARR